MAGWGHSSHRPALSVDVVRELRWHGFSHHDHQVAHFMLWAFSWPLTFSPFHLALSPGDPGYFLVLLAHI